MNRTTPNNVSAARYFKNYKLDYPNTETQKGSKKFVKGMKKLHVGITPHECNGRTLTLLGNHTAPHRVQPEVP